MCKNNNKAVKKQLLKDSENLHRKIELLMTLSSSTDGISEIIKDVIELYLHKEMMTKRNVSVLSRVKTPFKYDKPAKFNI